MPEPVDLTHPPRRSVLRGALALGAVGALTGCGGGSSSHSSAAQAPPAADTGGSTPAAVPIDSGPPTAASDGGSSSGGETLGPASDVPVGGGKIYGGPKVVVTQPTAGSYKGFSAICTHEGCTVSDISDGTINCPCHGSKYSINDGSVQAGPAPKPLPSKKVSVSGGNVSVTA
jgi:Rieske Fe-S protein